MQAIHPSPRCDAGRQTPSPQRRLAPPSRPKENNASSAATGKDAAAAFSKMAETATDSGKLYETVSLTTPFIIAAVGAGTRCNDHGGRSERSCGN